jgi:hypothetical protein
VPFTLLPVSVVLLALQDTEAFPSLHVHDHGPVPDTDDAIPTEQRLSCGLTINDSPFEEPQLNVVSTAGGSDTGDCDLVVD